MSRMIQIHNVPDGVHRRIEARAALAGMSISDYVLRELEKLLQRSTREELLERFARLPEAVLEPPSAEVLRAEREGR